MVITRNQTEVEEKQQTIFSKPAQKSYFGSIEKNEDPLFEVEKEYDNFDVPTAATKNPILPEFEILPSKQTQAEVQQEVQTEKQMHLSLRGKILACVSSMIIVLLLTLVIYNAVVLGSHTSEIAALSKQVGIKQEQIAELQNMLASSESEESVREVLKANNSALRKATSFDKVRVAMQIVEEDPIVAPTNWFDKLCDFLSNLF